MAGISFSNMLSTYSSWYHLNKANQFYCGPDHLVLLVGKKKKKILQFHQQLFIWRNYRTKAWSAAVVKERTLSPYGFLSSACIFPTAAWGHFPNGAWGQESIGTWKTLHECSISKVCPYSCLFLLQERHQLGFASLFFTMWICNPPGLPDNIGNRSWGSAV